MSRLLPSRNKIYLNNDVSVTVFSMPVSLRRRHKTMGVHANAKSAVVYGTSSCGSSGSYESDSGAFILNDRMFNGIFEIEEHSDCISMRYRYKVSSSNTFKHHNPSFMQTSYRELSA